MGVMVCCMQGWFLWKRAVGLTWIWLVAVGRW